MLDLEETFVYDSVVHSYNFLPSNFRNERHAEGIREMIYQASASATAPDGYFVTRDAFLRNWTVDDVANQLFRESDTDLATFQPLPLYAFEDGLCANEDAAEAVERYPERFDAFATVDPLSDDALEELERQAEWFDPIGLKLYPSSWGVDSHESWTMDDPNVAYPVFEKAKELGLDLVSVHKAVPFGPVPRTPYDPSDVDVAAESFPELEFSIVHGGFAFTEETAWQLARFPNVHVCLEALGILLAGNPDSFERILAEMVKIAGPQAYEHMYWSSAATAFHPQLQLEALRDFEFSDEAREHGYGSKIPQITDEDKRKILGENYAELRGIDVDAASERVSGDEFGRTIDEEGKADPWTTTSVEAEAII